MGVLMLVLGLGLGLRLWLGLVLRLGLLFDIYIRVCIPCLSLD